MMAGADPVEGTRWKTEAPFLRDLSRLYRDVSAAPNRPPIIHPEIRMSEAIVPPEYSFDGKVAIVTGAGDGIGFATVEGLARGGARVVCLDVKGADEGRRAGARTRRCGGRGRDDGRPRRAPAGPG